MCVYVLFYINIYVYVLFIDVKNCTPLFSIFIHSPMQNDILIRLNALYEGVMLIK